MRQNKKVAKRQYYVCDKKTGGTWFSCNSYEEAREWIAIAPFKANEPRNKFYVRKTKISSKTRRISIYDFDTDNFMENY